MHILWAILGLLTFEATAHTLRPGDVILQPMSCYLCRMIEIHEQSEFSHMGVVVEVGSETWIGESLGSVRLVKLSEFLGKGDKKRAHLVLRSKEPGPFLLKDAITPLLGSDYDHDFRWDNLGRDGREALYCSELIAKLLNPFLVHDLPTKIMNYDENRESWERYFRGNVPDGLPGNSPADFEKSSQFKRMGTYQDGVWNWN
jgi:Permuted papain-like amidase enzyme, YaeF/YiiX, C92 family